MERKMMFLVTGVCTVLVVIGSVQNCCPPPKLEIKAVGSGVMISTDSNDPYTGYSKIYHDEVNRKFVKDVFVKFEKAGPLTLFVLEDYAGGKQYTVLNGSCSVRPLTGDFNRQLCESQSNYKGEMNLGLGNDVFLMNLYKRNYSNLDYDISGDAMVFPISGNRCLLQSEMINAYKNSVFQAKESAFLYDAKASICNSSIFDVPTQCQDRGTLRFKPHFNIQLHALKINI